MKISYISLLVPLGCASAFAPAQKPTTTTELNLFGGGGGAKKGAGGPNMMDQLAMFKKASEMAQKKKKLDDELAKEKFEGTSENGKVTGTFKFVAVTSPMDPNPDYEATAFDFDTEWFEGATPEEISAAVTEAYSNGMEVTNKAMIAKYETLQDDLMSAFGGAGGKPAE